MRILRISRRVRQPLLLVVGTGLLVPGLVLLALGLTGYLSSDGGHEGPGEASRSASEDKVAALIPLPPGNIRNVPNLPIAIPYYNPFQPVRLGYTLVIDSIGVAAAPVISLGLDDEGLPAVPDNGQQVAWYDFTAKPGEVGNAVLAGHVNWARGPAVFFDLEDLQPGEIIRLIPLRGEPLVYEVTKNFAVDPKKRESINVMAPSEEEMLTLITCSGTWVPDPDEELGGSYTDRAIVQARRVQQSLANPALTP